MNSSRLQRISVKIKGFNGCNILFVIFMLVVPPTGGCGQSSVEENTPALASNRNVTVYDAGPRAVSITTPGERDTVARTFELVNTSTIMQTVVIASTSCRCISAELSGSRLDPGARSLITANIPFEVRPIKKHSSLMLKLTNKLGGEEFLRVPFETFFGGTLEISNSVLLFDERQSTEPLEMTVTERAILGDDMPKPPEVSGIPEWLSVGINGTPQIEVDELSEKIVWSLKFERKDLLSEAEQNSGSIQVKGTNCNEFQTIRFFCARKNAISMTPEASGFGRVAVGSSNSLFVIVSSDDGTAFTVSEFATSSPCVSVKHMTIGESPVHKFKLTLTPIETGNTLCTFRVKADGLGSQQEKAIGLSAITY
jgi:hypothetical protein